VCVHQPRKRDIVWLDIFLLHYLSGKWWFVKKKKKNLTIIMSKALVAWSARLIMPCEINANGRCFLKNAVQTLFFFENKENKKQARKQTLMIIIIIKGLTFE